MIERAIDSKTAKSEVAIQWYWKSFAQINGQDMHELLSLRQQVFVVEQNSPYLDADTLDEYAWHLLGRTQTGQLIAYARLTFPGTRYHEPSIGRVLVVQGHRNQGVGRCLMDESIKRCCKEYPGMTIRISAQTYLTEFYEALGFAVEGKPYDDVGVEHCDMVFTPEENGGDE